MYLTLLFRSLKYLIMVFLSTITRFMVLTGIHNINHTVYTKFLKKYDIYLFYITVTWKYIWVASQNQSFFFKSIGPFSTKNYYYFRIPKVEPEDSLRPLSLETYYLPLCFLGVGLMAATLALLAEICKSKKA